MITYEFDNYKKLIIAKIANFRDKVRRGECKNINHYEEMNEFKEEETVIDRIK